MLRRSSIWCKVVASLSILSMCFALAVPAMWTMHCVGTDRTAVQWGQARECVDQGPRSESPEMRVHCCSFHSVQSNIEEFDPEPTSLGLQLLVLLLDGPLDQLVVAVKVGDVQHHAHGPPLLKVMRCLLAAGQLRI